MKEEEEEDNEENREREKKEDDAKVHLVGRYKKWYGKGEEFGSCRSKTQLESVESIDSVIRERRVKEKKTKTR